MTIEATNADARPEDTITPAAAAADAPAIVDVDELELQTALTAAQAEETAGQDGTKTDTTTTGAPPAAAAPAAAAPTDPNAPPAQPAPAAIMVPKARLDEALSTRDRASQEAAYWRGVAEARATPAAAPGQAPAAAAPAVETPEQKLAAIQAETDALATRFDNGEITMADFKKAERELQGRENAIRDEALIAKVRPDAPAPAGDQLYLDSLTAQLETSHPWVKVMDAVGSDSDWKFLEARARENLAERGVNMNGASASYELRKEMAELADELAPSLVGAKAQRAGITLPGQPSTTQSAVPPAKSPQALAREAKLTLQTGAPPNLDAMTGATGAHPGAVSDEQIAAMSEDDIAALPEATRRRLLGIT